MFTAHTVVETRKGKKNIEFCTCIVLSFGSNHSGHCADNTENQPRVKRNVSTSVLLLGEEGMRYGVSA